MGKCIDKIGHECGSRNGLQVFEREEGGHDGYCFSCNTYVRHPYGDKPEGFVPPKNKTKTDEEIQEEIDEISTYGVQDIKARRLRGASLKEFGVKVGVNEADGVTPALLYFPYRENGVLVRYKAKLLDPKKHWSHSLSDNVDLFGWEEAVKRSPRKLIITEGECDAIALDRILQLHTKHEYLEGRPAVCSVPNGAGSALRDLTRLRDKINKSFKEVVFCFDGDDAGEKATEECLKIFPEATVVSLPEKDANECIIKGKTKGAFKAATFETGKRKNTRLVWGNEIHETAKTPAEYGVPWPWDKVTDKTRGIRTGETIYIGAAQKMGKSEIVNTLSAHLIKEVGWKVMVAKPEEANVKTYKLTLGKVDGKIFHDPKVAFDDEAYDRAGKVIGDNLCMVNLYQHLGWETLETDIRSAALAGCKAIFIDPITNLTNGMNSADANTKLQEIAQELSAMAKDLDVVIFIFCHLRNPESGLAHDRGGKVLTNQFAGSRAMGRSCNYMFGIEGNKDPDLSPEERNIRHLILLDDREYGEVADIPLYWDSTTTLFNEM